MATKSKAKSAASGEGKAERGGIQSVERAAAIMDAVARAGPDGVSLSEISEAVGLHVSTVFHLVKTLEKVGYLARPDGGKRYRIGSGVFTLAAAAFEETTLLNLGQPILERLSRETGEAAHLAVRSNADIVLIARTEATGMLQMSARTGVVRPAHATAIGKLLLAFAPEAERDRLLASMDLPALTDWTITDRKVLQEALAAIRNSGFAEDRQEFDTDVRCIAMPISDFSGRCVAAMGLSSPVWRAAGPQGETNAAALRAAASQLSASLGAIAPEGGKTAAEA